ncbi:ComEA family DNA-binding protein [Nocardia sp. NPDC005998]|uniref:ComEA family DNA-binding protein n=1 Tax=Nocardia sp. NPDC005998 TaxID=3156894 RepID=UPI0033A086B8
MRSAKAGRWDDEKLPSYDPEDARTGDDGDVVDEDDWVDGVDEVRTPGWLDEPKGRSVWRDRLVPERFRGTRLDPGWRGLVTLAMVGLAAVVIASVVVLRERPVAEAVPPLSAARTSTATASAGLSSASMVAISPAASVTATPAAELVVSVVGLVHRGGLVRLPAGSRVADALTAAGGAKDGADLNGLNLAQRLQDGDQVLVGPEGPNAAPPRPGSATIGAGGRAPSGSASNSAAPRVSTKVDLNTATEAELDALPGIGPVTAHAIIAWRNANGRFTDIAQLGDVDGIGPARLARLRDLVTI